MRAIALIALLGLPGCGAAGLAAPLLAECARNDTAEVTFTNRHTQPLEFVIDGVSIGILEPGREATRTIDAGQHTFSTPLCGARTESIASCTSRRFCCPGTSNGGC
jgi:hypothetical protein